MKVKLSVYRVIVCMVNIVSDYISKFISGFINVCVTVYVHVCVNSEVQYLLR